MDFDVAIVGGGPGGYVCAIRASQLGLRVVVIEKSELGGTCLNRGCIPTKSILHSAEVIDTVKRAYEFGINSSFDGFDLEEALSRSGSVVSGLRKGIHGLLAKNNIKIVNGTARFKDKNTLVVDDVTEITASNIVIATGASPKMLPGIDDELIKKGLIWTSNDAIAPSSIPNRILIVGSGAIGIEMASFFAAAGSDTTVVEIQDRILVLEDKEISKAADKAFAKRGIKIITSTKSQNFRDVDGALSVDLFGASGDVKTELFDVAMIAIGVVPNTSALNLEAVGIKINDDRSINVGAFQETNQSGIYAIGDVAKSPLLAHKASREGIIVAEKIAGIGEITPINHRAIPSCIYSNPQVASIGMTEDRARSDGFAIKVGKAYFNGNGKANASGEPNGFVKIIFQEGTGEILGAHMIGHGVSELIPILSVAIAGEMTEKELMAAVFPHPTMSEVIQDAVYAAFDVSINS